MDAIDYIVNIVENTIQHGVEYVFKRYYGIYPGIVVNNKDPEMKGRIVVKAPTLAGDDLLPDWAVPVMPAGVGHGLFHPPEIGDGVWLCFEMGEIAYPVYMGGWWAKQEGEELETPIDCQVNPPTTRGWFSPAGHGIAFNDKTGELQVKMQWKKKGQNTSEDKYSFIVMDKNGSVQMQNHKGTMMFLNAEDGKEGVTIIDEHGNMYASDKDGVKIAQSDGVFAELKKDKITLAGKEVTVAAELFNASSGGCSLGQNAQEPLVLGNKLMQLWTQCVTAFSAHVHPTTAPGSPTGPPTGMPWPTYNPTTNSLKNKTA